MDSVTIPKAEYDALLAVVGAAQVIDRQIWVPGAALNPDEYHDAAIRLHDALATLDQENDAAWVQRTRAAHQEQRALDQEPQEPAP
jgi:NADH:ubiquinone oxidoreductase subunit B-like Fe-S oxidoreductase